MVAIVIARPRKGAGTACACLPLFPVDNATRVGEHTEFLGCLDPQKAGPRDLDHSYIVDQ